MRWVDELNSTRCASRTGACRSKRRSRRTQSSDGAALAQDVRDVAAVEPFAFHHERLRPDHLLGGGQVHGHFEDTDGTPCASQSSSTSTRPLPPAKIRSTKWPFSKRFSKPVREHQFAAHALRGERLDHARPVGAPHEQIQIFRVADQPGVVLEGVGAADEVRNPGLAQVPQDRSIDIRGADVVGGMEDSLTHVGRQRKPGTRTTVDPAGSFVRVAAVGDLHYGKASRGSLQPLFASLSRLEADILVLCGDLTDYGLPRKRRSSRASWSAASRFRSSASSAITITTSDAVADVRRSSPKPASTCSTAKPSKCTAWVSPESRASPAASAAACLGRGARR